MTTRVAVTTTADRAPSIGALLKARGLIPVELPCIRIEPGSADVHARLRCEAAEADWIVVTSARTVRAVWPEANMPPVQVAAVGEATADAARAAGGDVAIVGTGGASDLVAELVPRVGGATLVFPHARAADPSTAVALAAAGATVVAGVAYDTVPVAPAADTVDAVILGSPTALRGWQMTRDLAGIVVAAMGETTATAVRAAGVSPDVVPESPSLAALVEALAVRLVEGDT